MNKYFIGILGVIVGFGLFYVSSSKQSFGNEVKLTGYITGMGAGYAAEMPISEANSVCVWREWRDNNLNQASLNVTNSSDENGHKRFYDYEPWQNYTVEVLCHGSSGADYYTKPTRLKDFQLDYNPAG